MHYEDILFIARSYSRAVGVSLSTIGNRALNNGRFFNRLSRGNGCTVRNYNRACQYLSDHWPEDLDWPPDIPRPEPSADATRKAA